MIVKIGSMFLMQKYFFLFWEKMMLLGGRFMSFTELIKTKTVRFPVFQHKHIAENGELDSLCRDYVIKRVLGCLTAKP